MFRLMSFTDCGIHVDRIIDVDRVCEIRFFRLVAPGLFPSYQFPGALYEYSMPGLLF